MMGRSKRRPHRFPFSPREAKPTEPFSLAPREAEGQPIQEVEGQPAPTTRHFAAAPKRWSISLNRIAVSQSHLNASGHASFEDAMSKSLTNPHAIGLIIDSMNFCSSLVMPYL